MHTLAAILATGFRKNKENKKKVVDFLDFDNQYLGNRKSDSNDFFQFQNLWIKDYKISDFKRNLTFFAPAIGPP